MTSVFAADESATKVLVDLARPDNSSARDSIRINFFIPMNCLRFFVVSPYRAIVRHVKIFLRASGSINVRATSRSSALCTSFLECVPLGS